MTITHDGHGRTRYRNLRVWWLLAGLWAFFVLLALAGALAPGNPILGRVACLALAILIVACVWRARHGGIEVSADEVIVRRSFGPAVRLPWSEVERFDLVPTGSGGAYVAVISGGRAVKTQGLTVADPLGDRAQRLLDGLEGRRPSPPER